MKRATILALLVLVALPALAERSKLEPPDTERFLRWGPVWARPSLRLRDFGHDDNIFVDNANRVSDFRASLAPSIEGLVLFGSRAFLEFDEELRYTAYAENDEQNFLDSRGSARLTLPLQSFGLFAELDLDRVKERPIEAEDIRRTRREVELDYGVIVELGWRTELELQLTETKVSYSDPDDGQVAERLDRDERGAELEARYRLQGRTSLLADYERLRIDFEDGLLSGDDSRDSEWRSWDVGVAMEPGGLLSGSLRLGRTTIDATDPRVPDLADWTADLAAVVGAGTKMRYKLDWSRRPGFSISGSDTYYINEQLRLRAVRYLNRVIGLELGGRRGNLEFPTSNAGLPRRDIVTGYELGVRFRLGSLSLDRRLEYVLRIGRDERDSNVDSRDRTQNVVVIDAIVDF